MSTQFYSEITLRKFFILLFSIVLMLLITSVSALYAIVDDAPAVYQVEKPTAQSLGLAKQTLKQINTELTLSGGHKTISLDRAQLSAIFALVSDIFSNISARQNSNEDSLIISAAIELPDNPLGRYININSFVSDDYTDSEVSRSSIGSLSLSNQTLVNLVSKLLLWRVGSEFIPPQGDLVDSISMQQGRLMLRFNSELNTQQLLAALKSKGKATLDAVLPENRFSGVQTYYDYLIQATRYTADSNISASLFDYLKLALKKAGERSLSADARQENTSALLAVALLVGDYELRRALSSLVKVNNLSQHQFRVTLAGRRDLNLHFIYSVVLTILSNQGVTLSIGEIKEISDSSAGGSGFSFIDLAADRSGVGFAEYAIINLNNARRLQENILQLDRESSVFPDTALLQEGLSEARFKQLYQNTASADYQQVVAEIDRRISALPVYQSSGLPTFTSKP